MLLDLCTCISTTWNTPPVRDVLWRAVHESAVCTHTQCFGDMQAAGFGHNASPSATEAPATLVVCATGALALLAAYAAAQSARRQRARK